ncbi:hypothetical protein [Nitrosomonas sp. ANs5]
MIEKSRSTSLALVTIAILGQPPSLAGESIDFICKLIDGAEY